MKMKNSNIRRFLIVFFYVNVIEGKTISLNGKWMGSLGGCDTRSFPVHVPGGIYSDLEKAKIIPENFKGSNDVKNRWVGNCTFTNILHFHVDETFLSGRKVQLIFHGLDTFANISLNGHHLGQTSNMFLRYIFIVNRFLTPGENRLEVVFESPITVANRVSEEQRKNYEVPPECVPKSYNGECHVNHIRKMQASFAWDWGPAFPSSGIWRDVELVSEEDFLWNDVTVDIQKENSNWKLSVVAFLDTSDLPKNSTEEKVYNITCSLEDNKELLLHNNTFVSLGTNETQATINLLVPEKSVKLWWPNGYGNQKLYNLITTIKSQKTSISKTVRIGFRTIELVQEPLSKGLSFYFRVNGVPIFAKGSNWIPSSVLPEKLSDLNTIRHLLESSKEVHMNMLRVWGGGVYESDLFYDLADELGIMIWQDFMFACSMYPTSEGFLKTVKEEVAYNVRRLKNHPSIALWAGNNENEAALYGNWYGTDYKEIYKKDYVKLYVDLIKNEVEQLDGRDFVVSSPTDGLHSEQNGYVGPNPYSNLYGDVHYYNYILNGWDITQYPRTRFASEYGFQSLPSVFTLATAIDSMDDLKIKSHFMDHRQHLAAGNAYMKNLISKNFELPESNNSFGNFIAYVYLSQINQAVSVKIQTEFYRQARSDIDEAGEGKTMGALYWQLNDVWQAPSWSSIDFAGRWKMLHYYAKEFFEPIIITSYLSSANELSIFVVSDELTPRRNCSVSVSVYRWNSTSPVDVRKFENLTIDANGAKQITGMWLNKYLADVNCGDLKTALRNCVVTLDLTDNDNRKIAPTNYAYPTALKNSKFPSTNITVSVNNLPTAGKLWNYLDYQIDLESDGIALFVWLDLGEIRGRFSENGFHMFGKKKSVIFHSSEAITADELRSSLGVISLADIYKDEGQWNFNRFFNL